MSYYSHIRRVTIAANMAETQDGVKAEDREALAAARKIAGDIEFDLFRGKDDFSNAGVFDGNPLAVPPSLPNMMGLGVQVRMSDNQTNTQDLMFNAFGSGLSNVIAGGGTLTQSMIEDTWIRGVMNMGTGDRLYVDPLVLSAYNKTTYNSLQRFNLGSAAQEVTSAVDIRRQAVSGGVVLLEPSRFLSGQTQAKATTTQAPAAPLISSTSQTGSTTSFASGAVYKYVVTAENELGESLPSATTTVTISSAGNYVSLVLHSVSGTVRQFNVFRSAAGGTTTKLIGRIKATASSTIWVATFIDANNRLPGGISGFLVQMDTMEIKELAPYSRLKLAITDLSQPEAHFRFCTLAVYEPRKDVILDNLTGSF